VSHTTSVASVAGWLNVCTRVVVLSGAGLSKASGIATYRDAGGLWTQGDNMRYSQHSAAQTDPQGFRSFWAARYDSISQALPNAAHRALAQLQTVRPKTVLATQNIDGLLTRAGATGVLELHGSIWRQRCEACGAIDPAHEHWHCLACRAPQPSVRPDVVMFGEPLDRRVLATVELSARQCQVLLAVGTTAEVQPAASLPEKARARGAKIVVVNPAATVLDNVADAVLRGPAEIVLPELVSLLG
jgi:NAD-dependent deacetylase